MRLSIMNLNLEKEEKKENDDVIAFKYQGIWSETWRVGLGAIRKKLQNGFKEKE